MKKIFKLFLCLLMLVSFTNITKILAEEEVEPEESPYISINDVAENYDKTNFMQALLIESQRENPEADLVVSLDETNHKIYLISNDITTLKQISNYCGNKSKDEELISVDELRRLKTFEAVILVTRCMPYRVNLVPDYKM